MKEKFWYFGYVVALLLILLIAFTDFPSGADMALAILFTCVFSVTHTQLLHRRMLHTDSSYRINVLDERNIAIKEKAGNIQGEKRRWKSLPGSEKGCIKEERKWG